MGFTVYKYISVILHLYHKRQGRNIIDTHLILCSFSTLYKFFFLRLQMDLHNRALCCTFFSVSETRCRT